MSRQIRKIKDKNIKNIGEYECYFVKLLCYISNIFMQDP